MMNWFSSLLVRLGLHKESASTPPTSEAAGRAEETPVVAMDANFLSGVVRAALHTHDDEMDCDECFAQVDAFVELHLAGKDAAAAMPLVQDHLQRCPPCQEEFEALLVVLETMRTDAP